MTDTSKLGETPETDAHVVWHATGPNKGWEPFVPLDIAVKAERQRDELAEALRRALNPSSSASLKFAHEILAKIEGERK